MSDQLIQIDMDYLSPNCSFIYPLYSKEGDKILNERTALSAQLIKKIKLKYGNYVYFTDTGHNSIIPIYRMNIAYNKSRDIMNEIKRSEKLSKTAYREAEKVIEEIISDLHASEVEAMSLLKNLQTEDDYSYQHSVNVGVMSAVFAKLLGVFSREEIKFLALGAYLFDIGSMKIDRQLLNKKDKYNISDMQKIKRHPQLGYEMLKKIPGIDPIVLQTVLFHHEKFNDRGYFQMPYSHLPLPPKIVSVCDIYDALTTKRPFREAIPPSTALKLMLNSINSHFDYDLISNFLNKMGPLLNNTQSFYTKNEFCELNTKEIAVIRDFGVEDFLKPSIRIFCRFERQNNRLSVKFYDNPVDVDLKMDKSRKMTKIINNSMHIKTIKSKLQEKNLI